MPCRESWGYEQFIFLKKCFRETPYCEYYWHTFVERDSAVDDVAIRKHWKIYELFSGQGDL